MKCMWVGWLCGSLAMVSVPALADKVSLPQAGPFEFDFCLVGEARTMSGGDKVFVSHYSNVANLRTEPGGRPFDRTSSLCLGTFASIDGKPQDFGVCELTDADGDKWWMEYHGNPDGSGGTYAAVYGTGKYAGMTVQGKYVLDFWPNAEKNGFQACNHNSGTYRLR